MRQEAMNWWNKIPIDERQSVVNLYPLTVGEDRQHTTLTGREIELIYLFCGLYKD